MANILRNNGNLSPGVLMHNHPSGDPTPSKADIEMTKKIVETAKHLGIAIHDHLVIGKGRHASFRTLGLLRSEEHTSELQSLMRISYAVFCLKQKTNIITITNKQNNIRLPVSN